MSEVLIEVSNVSKKYSTRNETIEAVSSMTFDIKRGEFLTIIGPSGCGKSTMLAMIAGLLLPSSGSIKVEGKEVEGPMLERIAVAFQEPGLLPWRNV